MPRMQAYCGLCSHQLAVAPVTENDEESDEDLEISSGDEDQAEPQACYKQQGEQIMSSPDNTVTVVIDRWLKFESTALDVDDVYCLHERLFAAMLFKVGFLVCLVKSPQAVLRPALGDSMLAIGCILSYGGSSSISPDNQSFDPQASKLDPTNTNKFNSGRNGFGFIAPGSFLRSLMSANTRVAASSHSQKVRDPMPNAPPNRKF